MCCRQTIGLLLVVAAAAAGRAQDWATDMAAGQAAFRQGQYQEAERAFQQALKETAGSAPNDLKLPSVLHDLGVTYLQESKYDDAERTLKQAIKVAESAGGANAPVIAADCDGLVRLYARLGRVEDAIKSAKRGLAVRRATLPAEDLEIATNLSTLGTLYFAHAKLTTSVVATQNAVMQQSGGSGVHTLGRARQLAVQRRQSAQSMDTGEFAAPERSVQTKTLYDGSRLEDAERYYAQALAIRERKLPGPDPLVTDNLEKLATTYEIEKKYADAGRTYARLLAVEQQGGSDSGGRVAEALDKVAQMDVARKAYPDAAKDYAEDIELRERLYGAASPQLVEPLKQYAAVLKKLSRNDEAKAAMEHAASILAAHGSR
jgi:tetratricopeptide (TPR) repeat protein